jgi:hypothetical protein
LIDDSEMGKMLGRVVLPKHAEHPVLRPDHRLVNNQSGLGNRKLHTDSSRPSVRVAYIQCLKSDVTLDVPSGAGFVTADSG